jgi:cystathionine beta-lyase
MNYDFDQIIDRKGTNSLKYDFTAERGKPQDILPLWVADMDFKTPSQVTDALTKAVQHGIFGYSDSKQEYFDAVYQWFSKRFGWEIEPKWMVKTPGVVYTIAAAIRAFTKEGDAILIQQPVYYPFSQTIKANNRELVNNSLLYKDGEYTIDFDDFEAKIVNHQVKMFILCSPHNPVGRVWREAELIRLGDICIKHGVLILSDEIHCDFTYKGTKHFIFTSLKPEYKDHAVVCTAPSKTFNLAGLQLSNIFIANRELKKKFLEEMNRTGYSQVNGLGIVACQAAYESGEEWLESLIEYLTGNLNYIRDFLAENLPKVKLVEPQGTYLAWLDFHELGLSNEEVEELVVQKAKLWLDGGTMFGAEGENFQRVNIACPREVLKKALNQLKQAIDTIG